ncbi:MAG: hypothetical protein P1U89_23610 [Verrucomicrobiales bacterium]|nr:hypothetical protein [Verrucomicrobiales bacterium]
MSSIRYQEKSKPEMDRLKSRHEELFLARTFLSDQSDEEQICGRAVRTLHFLCPEVRKNSSAKQLVQPEGHN